MSRGKKNGLKLKPRKIYSPADLRDLNYKRGLVIYEKFAKAKSAPSYHTPQNKAAQDLIIEAARYKTFDEAYRQSDNLNFLLSLPFDIALGERHEDSMYQIHLALRQELIPLKGYLPSEFIKTSEVPLEVFKHFIAFKDETPRFAGSVLKYRRGYQKQMNYAVDHLMRLREMKYRDSNYALIDEHVLMCKAMINLFETQHGYPSEFNLSEVHHYLNQLQGQVGCLTPDENGMTSSGNRVIYQDAYQARVADKIRAALGPDLFEKVKYARTR